MDILENMNYRKMPDDNICLDVDLDSEEIGHDFIEQLISYHRLNRKERIDTLNNYYYANNESILNKPARSDKKNVSDSRITSAYANYIVTVHQGMLVGNPVSYSCADEEYLEAVQDILNMNDEQDKNSELVKRAGILGEAYEICYINRNADFRFNYIDSNEVVIIYNTDINPDRIGAVRFYSVLDSADLNGEKIDKAEIYTKERVRFFERNKFTKKYEEITNMTILQFLNEVPVHSLLNNSDKLGDFELVISFIDAVDNMLSGSMNSFADDVDALLVLYGMLATQLEDIVKAKKEGALLLGENQDAKFLIKGLTNESTLNQIRMFDKYIHKFSNTIDITDENFANNLSGVAMKWKLFVMFQVQANKRRKLKRFLQDRLRMITTYLNTLGYNYDYRDIEIHFKDNLPINEKEQVEMVKDLVNIVSTSTALSQLNCVSDVQKELEKIEEENNAYYRVEEFEDEVLREEISENEVKLLKLLDSLDSTHQEAIINNIKQLKVDDLDD